LVAEVQGSLAFIGESLAFIGESLAFIGSGAPFLRFPATLAATGVATVGIHCLSLAQSGAATNRTADRPGVQSLLRSRDARATDGGSVLPARPRDLQGRNAGRSRLLRRAR
jgi:hypothetical protein